MLPLCNVTLVAIDGDVQEFADLLGTTGRLRQTSEGITFFPDRRNDWLVLHHAQCIDREHQRLVFHTSLGNTFHFHTSRSTYA